MGSTFSPPRPGVPPPPPPSLPGARRSSINDTILTAGPGGAKNPMPGSIAATRGPLNGDTILTRALTGNIAAPREHARMDRPGFSGPRSPTSVAPARNAEAAERGTSPVRRPGANFRNTGDARGGRTLLTSFEGIGRGGEEPDTAARERGGEQTAQLGPIIRGAISLGRKLQKLFRQRPVTDKFRKDAQQGREARPAPVSPDLVVSAARKAFEETNRRRAEEGKPDRHKITLTPNDIRPGASDIDAIQGFVEAHRGGKLAERGKQAVELRLGKVDPAFAARVKADTGIDLSGLEEAIDTAQVQHAFSRHGPGNERSKDQESISPEAVSIYRDAVRNYDRVSSSYSKEKGVTLKFEKDIDGVMVVIEQARTGRGTLSFYSMWIKKK
jgi:hypothetical protein